MPNTWTEIDSVAMRESMRHAARHSKTLQASHTALAHKQFQPNNLR
jgi:hypothetical protein